MQVSSLYIYPIKSLSGIELKESNVSNRGLALDRRWVLVDEQNYHVTQREMPEMVHLKVALNDSSLKVSDSRNGESITFSTKNTEGDNELVKVWDDEFYAAEVSKKVSLWFSETLKKQVRLMFQPDSSSRLIDERYAHDGEIVSNADGYPILIISEESLADLNARLTEPVEMLRFRPNIVLSGLEPFGEDSLGEIKIGDAEITGVKNCSRCIMVTNKPDGSARDKEPLKTLAQYRRDGKKVLFGRNFLIAKEGMIKVGMDVKVL
ncbi:MOSC domain-containing protein [Arcticibacterium luteifluviistationis]|uniref:MOSC domain-containing protein n=1 Tax=Arcticibacterium luteifluviistationis TaxID=1784714 RepID=A0A2Z4G8R7_9BACT|nr:MOSC N-terminal beta barrel domain-containing protein [Arcticibacterium luteifluviistationis]AWV97607.1 MOSC domain-containing protein [Arcticibacterium luteifluviistationis]